ncbi:MAG: hypothetical protein K2G20_09805, partial [Lachnospiraceae bacterium]|nr:hypothetical protein [Lachnospiraceae bacterium]
YNDSVHNYFSNESGSAIRIREDGQYTLSFDCGSDLSAAAGTAGVTGLNDLTAIYIKDDSVTKGIAKKSPLISCDIIYDSIVIDGVEFTVNMTEPKSALKASGILDTNDPINSWDGSIIEEVSVSNHVLNFEGIENPQHIEVTFTISNLVFEEGAAEAEPVKITSIEADGSGEVAVSSASPAEITVSVSPAGAGSVMFVSSDASIVSVDNRGVLAADKVTVQVFAHGEGEATVTAYTAEGLTVDFKVTATISPDRVFANVEKNEEPAGEESAKVPEQKKSGGIWSTVLLIAGIVLLGIGVFFITLKIAGGSGKPKKK